MAKLRNYPPQDKKLISHFVEVQKMGKRKWLTFVQVNKLGKGGENLLGGKNHSFPRVPRCPFSTAVCRHGINHVIRILRTATAYINIS